MKAFDFITTQHKFLHSVDTVGALSQEAKLVYQTTGLTLLTVDPACCCMAEVIIPTDAFESYSAVDGEIGIDPHRIHDMLSSLGKNDEVHAFLDDSRKISIQSRGLFFSLSAIAADVLRNIPRIPEMSYTVRATIPGREFQSLVAAAKKANKQYAIFTNQDGKCEVVAPGDVVVARYHIQPEHVMASASARTLYSHDYLQKIAKQASAAESVTLEFSTEQPLKVSYEVYGAKTEWLLAPRIEEDVYEAG
jgi:proliferating cell nuclear antigen